MTYLQTARALMRNKRSLVPAIVVSAAMWWALFKLVFG